MRSKSAADTLGAGAAGLAGLMVLAALAGPAMAQEATADEDAAVPVRLVAVYGHTGNTLDSSIFPLATGNFARRSDTVSLSADGETAGWSWRVRALATRDPQNGVSRQLRLKELNRVWQVSDGCYLSAGKRILAWDVGFLSQPVGFFQTQVVLTDLEDVAGNSEGLPLMLYSCALGKGLALDVVRSDDLGRDQNFQNLGLHQNVVRLSGHAGGSSFAVLARHVAGQGTGWGATWSATPADTVELHASLYSHRGEPRLLHQGLTQPTQALQFWRQDPYRVVVDDGYRTQALLGMTWTPRAWPVMTLEFAHDDAGLAGSQWRRWQDMVPFHQQAPAALPAVARDGNLLWDLATLGQRGTRRDYAYLQMQSSLWGQGYSIGHETSLNDSSHATFVSVRTDLSRTLFASASYSHFSRQSGTEFAYLPVRNTFTLRLVASF